MTQQASGTPPAVVEAAAMLTAVAREILPPRAALDVQIAHQIGSSLLTLTVAEGDLMTVQGPGGRTLRSLQSFLAALGARSGTHLVLDVQTAAE